MFLSLRGFRWLFFMTVALGSATANDVPRPGEFHAAFRPVKKPVIPQVKGKASTDIDRFLLARLEPLGLGFQPEANRPTLIRRVSFDLTGLAPTPAEIKAFEEDRQPDAYERMIERYLASPAYGERWGKYWLDAAGYADSNGYFNADSDRPLAWYYRDYVVRSLNEDKPYSRFVSEQIAGDEMAGYRPDGDVTPGMVDQLVATHFLRNAPDGTGESDGNPDEVRTDRLTVLEGNIQNLMNCLTGITIQCARCHDHKFEPVSQEEYYSLQAILFPVYNPDRWKKPNERIIPLGTKQERETIRVTNDRIDATLRLLQTAETSVSLSLASLRIAGHLLTYPEGRRKETLALAGRPAAMQTSAQKEQLKKERLGLLFPLGDEKPLFHLVSLPKKITDTRNRLNQGKLADKPVITAYYETDAAPAVHHLLKRGQHGKPGQEVQPGVPAILSSSTNRYQPDAIPAGSLSSRRRTALARWLTSPEHPLLARVMANRIWALHFGTGIVSTVDNLGASGAKPSHPELLDYLADTFVTNGWSIKAIHRLILRSAVYRQSSMSSAAASKADPGNQLLSRFPLRRLDAEAIRDAQLQISGELDPSQGGPYVASQRNGEGIVEIPEESAGAHRRSLYLQQRRTQVVTFLQLFDAPAMVSTCGRRVSSTVPLQALALLNSDFTRRRANSFAKRLGREAGDQLKSRLDLAWRLACGKTPGPEERKICEEFLEKQRAFHAGKPDGDIMIWTDLCQMILSSNAFLYVE